MGCGTSKCSSLVIALDGPLPHTPPSTSPTPTPTTIIASPGQRYNGLTIGEQVYYLYQLKQSSSSALQAWWVETEVASVELMARDGDAEVALVMKKGKELPQASIRFDKSEEIPSSSSSQPSRFVINLDKSWKHIAPVKALKLTQMQTTNGKALTTEQEKVVLRYISSNNSNNSNNSNKSNKSNKSNNNSNSNNGRESTVESELATSTPLSSSNKKHEKSRRKSMNHDILAAMQNNTSSNNINNCSTGGYSGKNIISDTGAENKASGSPEFKVKLKRGKIDLSKAPQPLATTTTTTSTSKPPIHNITASSSKMEEIKLPQGARNARIMPFERTIEDKDSRAPMLKNIGRHKSLELPQVQYHTEQVFSDRMEQAGMYIVEVEADGNCLFRSVAHQFYMDETRHPEIRKACIEHMIQYKNRFSKFCTVNFDDHVKRMAMDGTWGDDLEIKALEEIFDREFYIYAPDSTKHLVPVPINVNFDEAPLKGKHLEGTGSVEGSLPSGTDSSLPVKISYHGSCHYNSVFDQYHPLPLSVCKTSVILDSRLKLGS